MRNPSTLLRTWVCEHVLRALLIAVWLRRKSCWEAVAALASNPLSTHLVLNPTFE